ncbi:TetR family transcriptional regulator C-terminal domain-containing protein [Cupriavidus sp. D39]|uniref:TetR family transcriptional regulator C-terminal domain-containing protein n=1 Tax=Cupriavidus sp. D39 TaxID=2997877 RepID=UPI00226ECADD|nr:TetR family transcriptional regulator C-terminal domain-containing protein [Cupriavidus sp. D39]MCY0853192.1 TetR family transcriptional regulator C-terminal domain-containing protein [Cupriavidus sp. D39]
MKATMPTKLSAAKQSRLEVMDAIRRAAIREFSQHGFAGASTQAIAEGAGISKSALHYYIEDKEALYSLILSELMSSWAKLFEFDKKAGTPAEILSDYLRQKLTFTLKNPELSRIFTTELLSGGHRLERLWPDAVESTNSRVAVIERWVESGQIRPLNARLLIMHMWAMTQYYADYAIQAEQMMGASLRSRKTQKQILNELIAFVLAGCGLELAAVAVPAS